MSFKIPISLLFSLSLLLVIPIFSAKLTCLDRQGAETPWFTLIKYPASVVGVAPRYAYLDPNTGSSYEVIRGVLSDAETEAFPRTFQSINRVPPSSLNLFAYNDEPPTKNAVDPEVLLASYNAHAKGVIAFDNVTQTGVYIMHSIPNFPTINKETGQIDINIPVSGLIYGQHMYCISIDSTILPKLIDNFALQKPVVYFASGMFKNVLTNSTSNSIITPFSLVNGESQWFLTKNPKFNGFLFEHIVQPYFRTSLAVESWGRPYQSDSCPPQYEYATTNIATISIAPGDKWGHTLDHSKWAVSVGGEVNVGCFCDINRMESQSKRGGSCLCTKNKNIYEALQKLIVLVGTCPAVEIFV